MSRDEFWRSLLVLDEVPEDEIVAAERMGLLELYAIERLLLEGQPKYDVETVAELAGVSADGIGELWRALGFPNPQPGEPVFTENDVELIGVTGRFLADGIADRSSALQMARVIGSSMARIAVAQVEAVAARAEDRAADLHEDGDAVAIQEFEGTIRTFDMLANTIESVWRRHLAVVSRRRILHAGEDGEEGEEHVTVGFADLEGFTSLSQQLSDPALAELVSRFEAVAYDVVGSFDARVVKMIGDEVMFVAEDLRTGAELALTLAETYAADEAVGDVRVGLAHGPALKLEGDVYGPAVNVASRIVSIAYPGTVVVPREVYEPLVDDEFFDLRRLRSVHLRNIGRTKLWVLRRSGQEHETDGTLRRARAHRLARRNWIAETMGTRLDDPEDLDEPHRPGEGDQEDDS